MISINIELSFCNYSVTFTILYAFFIRLSTYIFNNKNLSKNRVIFLQQDY